jgi:hypothetical protein
MSLRDWFAGQALIGLVAGINTNPLRAHILTKDADAHGETLTGSTAGMAYELADAMLAARKAVP